MSDAACAICLDDLRCPVSTPCGHLHCEKCLIAHIETNADAMTGSCPSCRASFPIANPDLRFVPAKYHQFILPSVRRVFLDVPTQSAKQLQATVSRLEARVDALQLDKQLLMERCESAMMASQKHAEGERDVRIEKDKLLHDLQEVRRKYESLKGRYKEVKKFMDRSETSQAAKRNSSQAALDTSGGSSSNAGPSQSARQGGMRREESIERPVIRIAKRPRLLGSPFDPTAFRAAPAVRPAIFKKGRTSVMLALDDLNSREIVDRSEDDNDTTVDSSGGPQRSGLPTGDLFSPQTNRSLDSSCGSIRYGRLDDDDMEDNE